IMYDCCSGSCSGYTGRC
uniref:Alpha-conotoxin-like Sm1.4 n=1 Tax=Conus stercusmuscarum TaxID=89452 RepID=CA14_CONSE|nr:RecName: Full=Alpha-conotoxin-like Sm1.4; Flags: Precursor [Conus stercusmuscarum]